jgi:hypothetical protein
MSWNCNSSGFLASAEPHRWRAGAATMAVLWLAGCGPMTGPSMDDRAQESRTPAVDASGTAPPAIPPDAIAVTDELYMLPMGTDSAGCAVFQPWSPTMAVVQALHWRKADGSFTLDRALADCP